MIPLGKTEKMKLIAYTDVSMTSQYYVGQHDFQVNPESYSQSFQIDEVLSQDVGDPKNTSKYAGRQPSEREFEILIDGTGVIKNANALDVSLIGNVSDLKVNDQIKKLKFLCLDADGEIHRNYYLKVVWGDGDDDSITIFKGTLVSLDLNYKLFKSDGTPLRVIAKIKLREIVIKDGKRNDPASSPDITHQRSMKAGDKFGLLTYLIYKDSRYYIDVAKTNKLDGFRNIKKGTKINFYPLK
jgi:hypothetical protein